MPQPVVTIQPTPRIRFFSVKAEGSRTQIILDVLPNGPGPVVSKFVAEMNRIMPQTHLRQTLCITHSTEGQSPAPLYIQVRDVSDTPQSVNWDGVPLPERTVEPNDEEESDRAVQEESETETEFTEAARVSVASSPARVEEEHEPFVSNTIFQSRLRMSLPALQTTPKTVRYEYAHRPTTPPRTGSAFRPYIGLPQPLVSPSSHRWALYEAKKARSQVQSEQDDGEEIKPEGSGSL